MFDSTPNAISFEGNLGKKDIMFENTVESRLTISQSNAKKRPPVSEFGNTMNSNPSNDDTAHQILCVLCPPKKKVHTVSINHDCPSKKLCELDFCSTIAHTAGRCKAHVPKCEQAGCMKTISKAGRCKAHGPKRQK